MPDTKQLHELCINTIRVLAMDGVQQANSGHPGPPMGMAPMAYTLWTRFLKHNPVNPNWVDRDRFVLSAGHASMLIYSLLHLTGYDLPLEELQTFRQWKSRTPGHPEYGLTPGVETTTGPLGQGIATAVGMALAERLLAQRFNRVNHTIVDHYTYVIASDGDLMEGVAAEAVSLAGHLKLGKLICLYDDNTITIEGSTKLAFTENVARRFEAYGWHVRQIEHGTDIEVITAALDAAHKEPNRPSLICIKTTIAHGSPNKQGTAAAHGAPLGEEEIRLTKQQLGWPDEKAFHIPDEALVHFRKSSERGKLKEQEWNELFEAYRQKHPELAKAWEEINAGSLPEDWQAIFPKFAQETALATRAASGIVLNALAEHIPSLIGGSADLAPSNNTTLTEYSDVSAGQFDGRNLHFGVREHAMGAILNGLALHGGFIPYGGTFLVFSDYMRPAIRLAALMKQRVVYVFTHDSIGLGEDGPTHQPVEQLAALRAIPNLTVFRPADATETAIAWKVALTRQHGPTALILSRQKLPVLDRQHYAPADLAEQGAYILAEASNTPPALILIASGSEVSLALEAREQLEAQGTATRVVSMPSWEIFDAQPQRYRDEVFPPTVTARLAIEMGVAQGWCKYVGDQGAVLSIETFGASAPASVLLEQYGFTVKNIIQHAQVILSATSSAPPQPVAPPPDPQPAFKVEMPKKPPQKTGKGR